ncbi:potassium channel voltage-dependent beta subunit kcnab-related [Lucifera butyrica]|uniref:Potassium channel voltage-dependent beta subunit kcnab-related n=1 Tax=Lucifera butyrica TaxID=1351585 RepID=A0A498R0H0_9FIRM|nr:aldo/keto reductase [Lucifera butyrica]VBB04994.1 potassium channel voltage-dependent beta subunit kcnab-related [Lucifera butyrica]
MAYIPKDGRYSGMKYNRCGQSGLMLPAVSLGLWHNYGDVNCYENSRMMIRRAFDLGITHFDLANNYGPPPGAAEETFGRILKDDFKGYRDEMVIATKAGYTMWPGPYGDWGSKKYLTASLDQSLKRLKLEYVDILYHHRPDPETPLEETMTALDLAVRQGKALYAGISNYKPEQAKAAIAILRQLGTPCIIHQARYSMLDRWVEPELLDLLAAEGVGCIAFSPLGKGVLTNRYLNGIPADSRAAGESKFLNPADLKEDLMEKVRMLCEVAGNRGQSLAQMALAWVLRKKAVTSVLIGASKVSQIDDCAGALNCMEFSAEELKVIDTILQS